MHSNRRNTGRAYVRSLLLALALLLGLVPLTSVHAGTLTTIRDEASCLAAGGRYFTALSECDFSSYTVQTGDTLDFAFNPSILESASFSGLTNNGTFRTGTIFRVFVSEFLNTGTAEVNRNLRLYGDSNRNTGTINIYQDGDLDVKQNFTNEGIINVKSGGSLDLEAGASLTNNGTITLACEGTFSNSGTYSGTPPETDCTPPSVSVNQAAGQADPSISNPVLFTAEFSEPVTDFTSEDVTLSSTADLTGGTVTVSGGPRVYTISVDGLAGNGTLSASIAAGVATDAVGNGNTASTGIDNAVLFISDNTPPVITPNVSGTVGTNGWYTSDVSVSWGVSDAESAVASQSGCEPQSVASDTSGLTFTCAASSVGGSSSQSVTVKRDATLPTISAAATSAPNANGWYNGDVTVAFSCQDELSRIPQGTCPASQTLSGEGAAVSSSAQSVSDAAGNSASSNVVTVQIDRSAPVVSVTGVANGASYPLGSVPTAACSTSDALSNVATEATLSITGGNADGTGSFTATCSGATDNAGNTGSVSISYTVAYRWSGFFQPVDNLPTVNSVKAGSAIPVKFSLGGNYGLNIFAIGYPKVQQVACTSGAPIDEIEQTVTAGASGLSYDSASGQYSYTWKTDKAWAGQCRQLVLKLVDGTEHIVGFQFK